MNRGRRVKTHTTFVSGIAFAAGLCAAGIALPSAALASEDAPEETRVPLFKENVAAAKAAKSGKAQPDQSNVDVAEAAASESKPEQRSTGKSEAEPSDTKEEDKAMSKDTAEKTPEEAEAFRQTMHEGDIALGVCGARVSALLWFYEASVAQGRDDLKNAVASLTDSRASIKAEAERRAVDDGVDTSVRVMNAESEKIWNDLNEKAAGDPEDFQKAHDELFNGVQECLALFFDRPKEEAKSE